MNVNLLFYVKCSQCYLEHTFNAYIQLPDHGAFDRCANAADDYFDTIGWLRLPSGRWLCRTHRGAEAATERRAA